MRTMSTRTVRGEWELGPAQVLTGPLFCQHLWHIWVGSGASNLNLTERLDQSDWSGEAGTDDPHHEARLALAECRQSCQALINTKYSQSELPSIVQLYGGIQVIRQHNSILDQLQVEFCHRRFRIQISSLRPKWRFHLGGQVRLH